MFVVDDREPLRPGAIEPFPGTVAALPPPGTAPVPGPGDRDHLYLVDPHGNVMMRWPAAPDPKRMLQDLQRLLKASQIG